MNPHQKWMAYCLSLAEKGRGQVSPNPLVGACVVQKDLPIAEGAHLEFGGPHAEKIALSRAGSKARGGTLYVTLEPCSTFGHTPPCTDTVIRSGVRQVVIGSWDPNPSHCRKSAGLLKRRGIRVVQGILSQEVRLQNEVFFTFHTRKRPFIILKMAQSLDGKIATNGKFRAKVSSPEAATWTHRLRSQSDAVMAGTRTMLLDHPRLTPYLLDRKTARFPLKVVLDRRLMLGPGERAFHPKGKTIVFTSDRRAKTAIHTYAEKRALEVFPVKENDTGLSLPAVMDRLYRLGVTSLLVEGGGELAASLLEAHLVDKVYFLVTPLLIGGRRTVTSVEGPGISGLKQAVQLKSVHVSPMGRDLLVEAYV